MSQLKIGASLQGGKYKIEKVLGQGGFGITYQATQELFDRKVCVKEFFFREYCERDEATSHVTLGTQSSREIVERFMQKFLKEALTISKLEHPNIIRIHDIFKENNTAYYVMDYIDGENLNDMVKSRGALPEAEAVAYVKQVAMALDFVHQRKVNHLDVKPANIMVSRSDNRAILIDFGVSKQYDDQGEQTSTTPVAISHGYAPMEQYKQGGVSTFSPQTDIYALGATLYKLLTGETPPQAMDLIDEGLPPLPSTISKPVVEAIRKAMQFRKVDRPGSISEFLEILHSSSSTQATDKPEPKKPNDAEETEIIVAQEDRGESHTGEQGEKKTNSTDVSPNNTRVAKWYRQAAEQGNALAQYKLGECYYLGYGVRQDYAEAVNWFRKATEQGNAPAQYKLGECYYLGYGVHQDKTEAAKWYRQAAEQGNAPAQYYLGWCYYHDQGVSQNYAEAVKWYRKAARQGNVQAQYYLGLCYQHGQGVSQNDAEAVRWYSKAAEQGYKLAQDELRKRKIRKVSIFIVSIVVAALLCVFLLNIDKETPDSSVNVPTYTDSTSLKAENTEYETKAENMYRGAAERGDVVAQDTSGWYYEYSYGVPEDRAEAAKWYRKAAERGEAVAQNNLGQCYELGLGVTQNRAEAAKWYRKAAEQGDAGAQYNLGRCYYWGYGVPSNDTEVVKWFRKAAEQGHASAQNGLGNCYYRGMGVPSNDTEAVKWYRKAAEQGHIDAQYNLGWCYYKGEGVPQDYTDAVKWFSKAAEQGLARAQYHLGACYEHGLGVPQNYTEAVKWYRKAADQGHADAQDTLEELGETW